MHMAWRAQKVALLVGGSACLAQTVKFVKDSYELRNRHPIERAAQALLASQIRCSTPPAELIDRPEVVERFSHVL